MKGVFFIKKTIKATFENRDMAELALISLRRDNIPVLNQNTLKLDDLSHQQDIYYMAPIYSAHRTDTTNQVANQSVSPLPIISQSDNSTGRRLFDDIVSRDVRLEIEIPESYTNRARNKLISCHGYNLSESL